MTNKERFISVLQDFQQPVCDGCVMSMARLCTRQVSYMLANELVRSRITHRERGHCCSCRKTVLCNRLIGRPGFVLAPSATSGSKRLVFDSRATPLLATEINPGRPWHWEGNVQALAASWLEAQGWTISQPIDKARTPGIDLVATQGSTKTLWVTVKGFPERSQCVQARHWFAGAILDLVSYRNHSSEVYLAAAFPDGYPTYEGLAARVVWLKRTMPFSFLWVARDGTVRSE